VVVGTVTGKAEVMQVKRCAAAGDMYANNSHLNWLTRQLVFVTLGFDW